MKRRYENARTMCRKMAGSTVTEYAVIIAIVSIAGVLLLFSIGQSTNGLLEQMNTNMPQ